MTEPAVPPPEQEEGGSVTGMQTFYDRAGGLLVPVAAAALAFLIGGLVVAITGKSHRSLRGLQGDLRRQRA